MKKVKAGFFSLTCCEGCTIVVIEALNTKYEEWTSKMQIQNFRALKKYNKIKPMDIAFVEGAISTQEEVEKIKEIRANTKKLIALGSGASNGYPSNQRNTFNQKMKKTIEPLIKKYNQLPTIEPLEKYVKVDIKIDGCPVNREELIKKMDELLKNA